ncbi:MAG TPA: HAD hydrolase-like protein [Acetobacteraceae bacterium]|nr:HAD hydrolase-like protein [Acetobacteraceae bacterium]
MRARRIGTARMNCRLAIFDFDGTLADSFAWFLDAYDEAAAALGLMPIPRDEVPALRHLPPRALLRRFGVPAWRIPQVAARIRALQSRDIARIGLFPGIPEMIAGIAARGVTLAIVTSNSEENVRAVLGEALSARFAHLACGVAVLGKGVRLRRVLRKAGVAPAEAIAIGDELRDLEAAQREGIPFGAVAWGYADPEALRAAGPARMFSTPGDVLAALT